MALVIRHSPPVPPSKTGMILLLDVTGVELGRVTYGIGPGDRIVRSTNYLVDGARRRKGIGHTLARALFDYYPEWEVAEGGGSNSTDGDQFLVGLRSKGLPYHRWECFLEGSDCLCAIGGRVRD